MEDVGQAAWHFPAMDGIYSNDNQIAVPDLGEQWSEGRVSRPPAVPICLTVNLHRAKVLRQAR
jgi:hypothetical protein